MIARVSPCLGNREWPRSIRRNTMVLKMTSLGFEVSISTTSHQHDTGTVLEVKVAMVLVSIHNATAKTEVTQDHHSHNVCCYDSLNITTNKNAPLLLYAQSWDVAYAGKL